jgi:thioredoxin-like negative regulator of GroEL
MNPTPTNYLRNLLVAIAAIVLTVTLFFSLRVQNSEASLTAVAKAAMPLELALANPQPTVMEFYADWCTSCQSMAADNLALQKQYAGKINFVMLNVDNSKWLPEVDRFKVDGIPHFVFLASDNSVSGTAIGAIPRNILTENLEAMLTMAPLPHIRLNSGETSPFNSPRPADTSNPRDHG